MLAYMLMMHGSHVGVHGDALRQHFGVHANGAKNMLAHMVLKHKPCWRTW